MSPTSSPPRRRRRIRVAGITGDYLHRRPAFQSDDRGFFREHQSKPRNPMIARLTREAEQEPPTGSLRPCAAVVTFGFATATTTGTPGTLPGDAGKAIGKVTGIVTGKTPMAVLRLLAEDPNLSVPQVAARLKKSELTIHRTIRTLRESGRLTRVGPEKGGLLEGASMSAFIEYIVENAGSSRYVRQSGADAARDSMRLQKEPQG